MVIDYLVNNQKLISEVTRMIYEEFVLGIHTKFSYNDILLIHSRTYENKIPLTFVAIENEVCLGTASIFENDLDIRRQYTPWLASLYVKTEHRNEGIGCNLIAVAIDKAKDLGFDVLYLRTETASKYYIKNGWSFVETVSNDIHKKIDIFKINIF